MQIHVIRAGDSLTKIGQAYGISAQEIAVANQVPDQNRLVSTTGSWEMIFLRIGF